MTALASAHTLASAADGSYTDVTDEVGTGSLTFKFGTTALGPYSFTQNPDKATETVTIDASNNSLEGIRDAVNSADIGVSASIVYDGDEYRLTFVSAETGAANSLQITVDDTGDGVDTDNNGLSRLAYNGGALNMEQTAAAQDAALTVNGIPISSATNVVADAIEGVTLTLKAAGTSSVTLSQDDSAALDAAKAFVNGYNALASSIDTLSGYNADTEQGGILIGDATTRNISSQLRRILGGAIGGVGGAYNSLATVGITTDAFTGKLQLDESKFNEALTNDADSVARLFAATASASDALVRYDGAGAATVVGDYAVNITQLATQGSYTGADIASFTVDADNDTFAIKLDGIDSGTITLTQGSYTATSLAAELQARINGDSELSANGVSATVTVASNKLLIKSDRYGSASTAEITSVDTSTAATLGLSVAAGSDGLDVAGTIGGIAATGAGRFLTGTGNADGLKIEILGGATGDRGTLNFTRGYADLIARLISDMLESNSALDSRSEGLETEIEAIAAQRQAFDRRMSVFESRVRAQFTALDGLLGQLEVTSTFLTQQLAGLQTLSQGQSR